MLNNKTEIQRILSDSIQGSIKVKQELEISCREEIISTSIELAKAYQNGGKLLFCGNGGSAADSQHIAAELVVRFRSQVNRPSLSALSLTVDTSILTAGGNDIGFDNVFAREVEAYGKPGDVLIGISTSGNSENIIRAVSKAKQLGLHTIGLLGNGGGKLKDICRQSVIVPSSITARIQESHILVGHIWCEIIETILFPAIVFDAFNR